MTKLLYSNQGESAIIIKRASKWQKNNYLVNLLLKFNYGNNKL